MPIQYNTAAEAVRLIQANHNVFLHSAAATPKELVQAMALRSSELSNVGIYSMHTEWDAPYAEPEHVAAFDVNAFFVGSNIRKAVNEGRASYVPMFLDRKSTRLNSSHVKISYAVFCSNKKQ